MSQASHAFIFPISFGGSYLLSALMVYPCFLYNLWKQRVLMLYIGQSTQSVIKNPSGTKCRLCMHHMCTPFNPVHGKNITRFCVTAAKTKSRPPPARLPFLLPYISRKKKKKKNRFHVFDEKRPRTEECPEKDETTSFPSWTTEKASFLLLSARLRLFSSVSFPNDANKIRINITHLVAAARKHVSF